MSHGLTLTEASTIVWWAPVTSNETYEQANGRINRPGQRNNMLVVHLTATKIERAIYKRLEEKQKLQGLLLEMVAEASS
jgi:SNF2 family DNA or RNA helicase